MHFSRSLTNIILIGQLVNFFFSLLEIDQNDSTVIVALSSCQQFSKIPATVWKYNILILLPQSHKIAKNLQLTVNSRIYYLDEEHWLHEIYRYNWNDQNYTQIRLGQANSSKFGLNLNYIWERRSNLSNIHLNIIYRNLDPYTNIAKSPLTIKGYLGELFLLLQEKLKFNFTLIDNEDDCWGTDTGNGTYNCMFGKLQRGQSNWSIAECSKTEERSLYFDFSMPLYSQPKKIVTRDQCLKTFYACSF